MFLKREHSRECGGADSCEGREMGVAVVLRRSVLGTGSLGGDKERYGEGKKFVLL